MQSERAISTRRRSPPTGHILILSYMLQTELIDQLLRLLPAFVQEIGWTSSTARMFSSTVSLRKTRLPAEDS